MNVTYLVTLILALIGLGLSLFILQFVFKAIKLSDRVRENITTGVYILLIAYVAVYYIIRPLSQLFGDVISI